MGSYVLPFPAIGYPPMSVVHDLDLGITGPAPSGTQVLQQKKKKEKKTSFHLYTESKIVFPT